MKPRKSLVVVVALLLIGGAFVFGMWVGIERRSDLERLPFISGAQPVIAPAEAVNFSPFWEAWRLIEERFASENGIDRQAMVWGAISGMVKALDDPYTVFLPPKEQEAFTSEIKGEFGGIGAEIGMRKGILVVIAPLEGSPAEQAGIKAGDKILKIDETPTGDLTLEEAVRLIRGPKGTSVVLTILHKRGEDTNEVKVTRDTIRIPTLKAEARENGIFLIRLYNFNQGSVQAFRQAVRDFLVSGSDKLIVDVRNNPGGFLDAAVDIASWFLPEGTTVAREVFYDDREILYRSHGYGVLAEVPTVILINEGSASASEILAGALREERGIKLIGEKTFGKGSIQQVEPITADTALKVTIARWLTPKGVSISKEGLSPDIEVVPKEEEKDGESKSAKELKSFFAIEEDDPVLERAIEYLLTNNR